MKTKSRNGVINERVMVGVTLVYIPLFWGVFLGREVFLKVIFSGEGIQTWFSGDSEIKRSWLCRNFIKNGLYKNERLPHFITFPRYGKTREFCVVLHH